MTYKLLFVDDDEAMCGVIEARLTRRDFEVVSRNSAEDALVALDEMVFDVVATDLHMPGVEGLEFCRRVKRDWPMLPVVVVTAFGSMETAIAAIRAGAYDFITKPFQLDELLVTLGRAVESGQLTRENKRLRAAVASQVRPAEVIGDSPVMQAMYGLLARIADSQATVLVTGESGTGKELIARSIHTQGNHASGPFIAINCAAVPEGLMESELFGHTRGAFTDATRARPGLFSEADGGTLFLDEIGEMPSTMQVKLLRALQERKVRPVGGNREIPFDCRIIAATSRDLECNVAEGRFREDLYYRINVLRIEVPPLRARGPDVLRIAEHCLAVAAERANKSVVGISRAAAKLLLAYSWPGNVRELQNCIERAVALTSFEYISQEDLPERVSAFQASQFVLPVDNPAELLRLSDVEKRYILCVLEAVHGSKSRAAAILDMDRRTLYRKLKRWAEADSTDAHVRGTQVAEARARPE